MSCHWTTGQRSNGNKPLAEARSNTSTAPTIEVMHACRIDAEGQSIARARERMRSGAHRDVLPTGAEIQQDLVSERLACVDDRRKGRSFGRGIGHMEVLGANTRDQPLWSDRGQALRLRCREWNRECPVIRGNKSCSPVECC